MDTILSNIKTLLSLSYPFSIILSKKQRRAISEYTNENILYGEILLSELFDDYLKNNLEINCFRKCDDNGFIFSEFRVYANNNLVFIAAGNGPEKIIHFSDDCDWQKDLSLFTRLVTILSQEMSAQI